MFDSLNSTLAFLALCCFALFVLIFTRPVKKSAPPRSKKAPLSGTLGTDHMVHVGGKTISLEEAKKTGVIITGWYEAAPKPQKKRNFWKAWD